MQARALGGLLRLNGSADAAPAKLRAPPPGAPRHPGVEARTPASPTPLAATVALEGQAKAHNLDGKLAALAAIDELSELEKLRLFA